MTPLAIDERAEGGRSVARGLLAFLPLVVLPAAAWWLLREAAAWQLMWGIAVALYAGLKWMTFVSVPPPRETSWARVLGYLFLWPGMNAAAFWRDDPEQPVATPGVGEWLFAAFKLGIGLALVAFAVPVLLPHHDVVAGWVGMAGVLFVLHFGLFHLLSLVWRSAGVEAEPLMNWPVLAASVADFWGRRWNLAFRDLAFTYLFRPLAGPLGAAWAMLAVFVLSGVIHDLVISLPVGGGYGGPTIYFTLQGVGMLLERSPLGRRLGLGEGLLGWAFTLMVTLAPAPLLFHPAFVRGAILPTLAALTRMQLGTVP